MRYCRLMTEEGPQWAAVEERGGEMWVTKIVSSPEEDRVHPYTAEFVAVRAAEAQLLAPVKPSKIVCVGRNYADHAKELGNEAPLEPLLFLKAPSAVIGQGETVVRPAISQRVDFEGELGIVIGKRARDIKDDDDPMAYIRGYVCVNDVTARDLQKKDDQWTRAKGFDTFCPVGPWVVERAVLDPLEGIALTTRLNGAVKQQGSTRDMIFNVPFLVRYISRIMTLMPGDLVATGTPAGVGPMAAGDVVEVEIAGLGVLRNPVV
jgi:2-keto-4-pentenoate hydratase/2-oxohepta-3-ene-1,7-dioic acid hydratase in catechol pathway